MTSSDLQQKFYLGNLVEYLTILEEKLLSYMRDEQSCLEEIMDYESEENEELLREYETQAEEFYEDIINNDFDELD